MTQTNSADHAPVRGLILSAVLRFIDQEAPLSRSRLALQIGLNKSAIPSFIQSILDAFGPGARLMRAAAVVDNTLAPQ